MKESENCRAKITAVIRMLAMMAVFLTLFGSRAFAADDDSEVTGTYSIYVLSSSYQEYISIPEDLPVTWQISDTGLDGDLTYSVISGSTVTVSSDGLVEPKTTTYYWVGNVGYSYSTGAEGEVAVISYSIGTSRIKVTNGTDSVYYDVTVVNYATEYAQSVMDTYLEENITDDMTDYEKAEVMCQFVASYDYSASYTSYTGMIVTGGGDCWASSNTLLYMLDKEGISAHLRYGANDSGSGSGHRNVAALLDGEIYILEAGYTGTAPRSYKLTKSATGFTLAKNSDGTYKIVQYDGFDSNITVPSSINGIDVTVIGAKAFYYGEAYSGVDVESVTLPETITTIMDSAFNSCSEITSITIPASVTSIGDFVFTNASSLQNIYVEEGNEYYQSVDGVLFSKDLTTLIAFPNGRSGSYVIPDSVETVGTYAFYYAKQLTELTLGANVKVLEEGAISDCTKLTNLILNDKLEEIGSFAFSYTKMTTLTLPASVTTIDDYAFCYATSLTTVLFEGEAPIFSETAFYNRTLLVYYRADKDSWTEEMMQDYSGTITWESWIPGSYISYLGTPTLTVSAEDGSATLSWTEVPGAVSYQIYRKTSSGEYSLLAEISELSYIDEELDEDVYVYQVYASAYGTLSEGSTEKTVNCLGTVTDLAASNVYGGITLTWSRIGEETTYYLYYKSSSSIYWTMKIISAVEGDEQSYTYSSASSGTTYSFYIKVYKDANLGAASETVSLLYLARPNISLTISETGNVLSWSAVTGAEGYLVYRKGADESYQLMVMTEEVTVTDSDVESGETYTYQVFAYAEDVLSGGSTEKSRMYLDVPVIISVSNGISGISLTWETVGGAEKYYIYYKTESSSYYSCTVVTAGDESTQSASIGASSGNIYLLYVKAYADGYYSASTEVHELYYLKRPTVTLTTDENGNVLSWSAITGAESYVIYRKTEDGEYSQVVTTTETSWTDADIVDGVTYTYQVYAYTDGTYSAGSAEKSGGRILMTECTITLSSTTYTYNGAEKTPTVTVKYGSTKLTKDTNYTVAYSDNINAGTATVTVTGLGKYAGTATVIFTINKASQTVSASISSSYIQFGNTATITASGTGTISYVSNDTSVATVSSDGVVTGTGYGSTTITVTASGNENYAEASKTVTVYITRVPLSSCTVELDETAFVYDGTEKTPGVTVTYGGLALTEGADYTLSYSSNVNAGTGTVTVTSTGTGNSSGTVKTTFTIEKAAQAISVNRTASVRIGNTVSLGASAEGSLSYTSGNTSVATVSSGGVVTGVAAGTTDITVTAAATANYDTATVTVRVTVTKIPLSECTATLGMSSYVYDGSAKTPVVTVKYGTTTLTQGTDYTVSYTNNTNVGTATVTVTGTGKYEGTITKTFAITKADQTLTAAISSTVIRIGGTATITASGQGTITYASDNTAVATVSSDGAVTGVGIGTANITVTAAGNSNYNAAARTIQVSVKEKVIEITGLEATLSASTYTYDGNAKTPSVTVKTADGATLTQGTDYTVAYTNNINPGTATVTITGIGDYGGTITLTFEIKLASCSVRYINNTMDGFKVVWYMVEGASGYYIYRRNDDGTYSTAYTDYVEGESTTEWIDPLVLTGGKDYTYKVAAYYEAEDGTITVGPSGTTKTCKYLKGGEVESVTNTTSGLKVTWTKVDGANGYYIFRKAAGEDDYTQVATVQVTSTSTLAWTDTDSLTSGKNYTYKVSAIFTNSKGQVTKGGAKVTKTAKYLAPGKISSLANTSSGIYIKWTKVTGATGYYVYRKASSASSYTLVTTITGVGTVSYTDTAVVNSNNVTYIYYIQPYYKSSVGVITKAGYTTKTIVRLVAPTISSLTNSAANTMTVKWGTKSGVTGYQVQYSTSSSFASGNKTLTLTGASTSSEVISSLTKGKTYYVRIRTYKTVNGTTYYSAWCTVKSVKISK